MTIIQLTGVVSANAIQMNGVSGVQQIFGVGVIAQRGPKGDPATNLVTSVNGKQGVIVINKSDVGLGNVDNTSDLTKPISNPTKTYVDNSVAAATIPDATTTTKGKIKLANDLSGTADLPVVVGAHFSSNGFYINDASGSTWHVTISSTGMLTPIQNNYTGLLLALVNS